MAADEQEMDEEVTQGQAAVRKTKNLRERLHLSSKERQNLCVAIMQIGFSSMAVSLLTSGMVFLCIVAGLRNTLTINVLVYTSYASIGAIGLISAMVIALNILSMYEPA